MFFNPIRSIVFSFKSLGCSGHAFLLRLLLKLMIVHQANHTSLFLTTKLCVLAIHAVFGRGVFSVPLEYEVFLIVVFMFGAYFIHSQLEGSAEKSGKI